MDKTRARRHERSNFLAIGAIFLLVIIVWQATGIPKPPAAVATEAGEPPNESSSTDNTPTPAAEAGDEPGGALSSTADQQQRVQWCGASNPKPRFHIFQASPVDSGSTLVANILYGLICPDDPIQFGNPRFSDNPCGRCPITKTHDTNFAKMERGARRRLGTGPGQGSFFVTTTRGDRSVGERYCGAKVDLNVLCLEYDDFVYTDNAAIRTKVQLVADALRAKFPALFGDSVLLDVEAGVKRIEAMEAKVIELKDQPFETTDEFFQLHGHHKGRLCSDYHRAGACASMKPGLCCWDETLGNLAKFKNKNRWPDGAGGREGKTEKVRPVPCTEKPPSGCG